jgi:hypothetical protein
VAVLGQAWRKVTGRSPISWVDMKNGKVVVTALDILECGHRILQGPNKRAKKRQCKKCGAREYREGVSPTADDLGW